MKRFIKYLIFASVSFFIMWPCCQALDAQAVYNKVNDSIFTLFSLDFQSRQVKARGSAVAIAKTIVVTNCHVALSGDYLIIKLHALNNPSRVARLFYKNEKQDLCLLEIPGENFTPAKIRASTSVKIGEVVYAIGNPKGTERTISQGIVSNRHPVTGGVWLQTDARIYFGSSGGGLFDASGNLVGITTKMGGNFGFALPTEWITEVMSPKVANNDSTEVTHKTSDTEAAGKQPTQADQPNQSDQKQIHVRPEAVKGLSYLGEYGKDHIALYKNNHECFLLISGKDTNGNISSSILWNPKYETTFIIFPSTAIVKEAMGIIYQAVQSQKSEKQSTYRSQSQLYIADHPYPLYGTEALGQKYPFLVLVFSQSPRSVLLNAGAFKIVFRDQSPSIGNATVMYSLVGMAEALSAYHAKCL